VLRPAARTPQGRAATAAAHRPARASAPGTRAASGRRRARGRMRKGRRT
jgi:hypothetical protein